LSLEEPYDFYDIAADPFDHSERLNRVGLRPDLTGRGLGEAYLRAQPAYAPSPWFPRLSRLYVASWNDRAIKLYEQRHMRSFERFGEHGFIRMERPA
jgi:ribosomal protein S18 acetylase RimI-like enzyme